MTATEIYNQVAERIDAIEAEMRRIGAWREARPPEEAFQSNSAFLMDTMDYCTWLTFVFVKRVRDIIEKHGELPPTSSVGVQAMRNFDGWPEANGLVSQLSEFDALVVRAAGVRGPLGQRDLEYAAAEGKSGTVRTLLAAGVPPTTTALTWATSKGDLETVRLLLDAGVACDARDCYGVTPAFFAAGGGNEGICAFLIDPDQSPPGTLGKKPIVAGHTEALRLLIERGAPFDQPYVAQKPYTSAGATPLIVAAAFGNAAGVAELLAHGARVDTSDRAGRTAAEWATRTGHPAIASRLRPR